MRGPLTFGLLAGLLDAVPGGLPAQPRAPGRVVEVPFADAGLPPTLCAR